MSEILGEGYIGATGLQPPVGTQRTVEQLVASVWTMPHDRQLALLRALCPFIVPRLADRSPREFIDSLRDVVRHGDLSTPARAGQPADAQQLEEEILRQSVGGQEHFLMLVAPRIVAELPDGPRARFLAELEREIAAGAEGANRPEPH